MMTGSRLFIVQDSIGAHENMVVAPGRRDKVWGEQHDDVLGSCALVIKPAGQFKLIFEVMAAYGGIIHNQPPLLGQGSQLPHHGVLVIEAFSVGLRIAQDENASVLGDRASSEIHLSAAEPEIVR
jgi:hypothetical protein